LKELKEIVNNVFGNTYYKSKLTPEFWNENIHLFQYDLYAIAVIKDFLYFNTFSSDLTFTPTDDEKRLLRQLAGRRTRRGRKHKKKRKYTRKYK